jgi:hypothetical protein
MSGDVSGFVFGATGHPLYRGAFGILLIYLAVICAVIPLGFVSAYWTIIGLCVTMYVLPPLLSAIVSMRTLNDLRRSEMFDELAMLPYQNDSIRTMILLPSAISIRLGSILLAWIIAIMPLFWIANATAQQSNIIMGGNVSAFQAGLASSLAGPFILVVSVPAGIFCFLFACAGIPTGWFLATRFYGSNAFGLALAHGFRIIVGVGLTLGLPILARIYVIEKTESQSLGTVVLIILVFIFFMQTIRTGLTLPRKWALLDTHVLIKYGVDILRSPESFRESVGRPSQWKIFFQILWAWPRLEGDMFFEKEIEV